METFKSIKVSIVLRRFLKMEIKKRILKGSEELFFRFGIKSITMDDVAKHLGISKKTIYLHFKDKNEVVHSLMLEKLKEDEKEFKQIVGDSENVIEEVFSMMKHMGAVFSNINPAVFYDLQKYHPKSWKLFKEFKENCIMKMVEEILMKGIKQGLIRPNVNVKILSRMRMEQVELGFNPTVFPPDKFRIIDVQISLLDHFLYGICSLKGHKLVNKYNKISDEG